MSDQTKHPQSLVRSPSKKRWTQQKSAGKFHFSCRRNSHPGRFDSVNGLASVQQMGPVKFRASIRSHRTAWVAQLPASQSE